jgi:hypothetical protein
MFDVRWFHLRLGYGATGEARFGPGDGAANDGYRVGFGEAIKAHD